ncbi:MAG: phage late control D family protein [Pseudonocardia sp.]|nr:MAG: phage late control D family protein [Pseudonocardia sp.]
MSRNHLRIEVGGEEVVGLYEDLVDVEVDLDDELSGMFRIGLAVVQRSDGTWPYLDDDRFRFWQTITITAAVGDDEAELISGYITHLRPDFAGVSPHCRLELWGMDATVLMDRRLVVRDWPNRNDSEIAREIFGAYGLDCQVTDTGIVHDEEVSTILQRETDIRFLKRLARRNGYDCFVAADKGYFSAPDPARSPKTVLKVLCGEDSTVTHFSIEARALGPTEVAMTQIDHHTKEVHEVAIDSATLRPLGSKSASDWLAGGMFAERVDLAHCVTTGVPEMDALCRGIEQRREWFVTGKGDITANVADRILIPRELVTIAGIGETYSGTYYVIRVVHVFTPDGYTQRFTVRRNALAVGASDDFSVHDGALSGASI